MPWLARVAEVLSRHSLDAPGDLDRLATQVTLAVAIGNLDLHAKNLALLHPPDGTTALAPTYDMVPLAHVPGVDGRLAMAGRRRIRPCGNDLGPPRTGGGRLGRRSCRRANDARAPP